jgi:hypothetical protein
MAPILAPAYDRTISFVAWPSGGRRRARDVVAHYDRRQAHGNNGFYYQTYDSAVGREGDTFAWSTRSRGTWRARHLQRWGRHRRWTELSQSCNMAV